MSAVIEGRFPKPLLFSVPKSTTITSLLKLRPGNPALPTGPVRRALTRLPGVGCGRQPRLLPLLQGGWQPSSWIMELGLELTTAEAYRCTLSTALATQIKQVSNNLQARTRDASQGCQDHILLQTGVSSCALPVLSGQQGASSYCNSSNSSQVGPLPAHPAQPRGVRCVCSQLTYVLRAVRQLCLRSKQTGSQVSSVTGQGEGSSAFFPITQQS